MTVRGTTPPVERRSPLQWFAQGGWYYAVVVLSFGLLSPIPFAHAAARLRNPAHWITPVAYAIAVVTAFASTPPGTSSNAGASIIMGVILIALVHLTWLRRRVWPRLRGPEPVPEEPTSSEPAVAAALAARRRRVDARKLVADDPLLARELKIGRPDLRRDYDDGGLVDLNSAPVAAIAGLCNLDPSTAQLVVDARAAAGAPFGQVDDMFAYTDIPVALWDRIRDRAVIVP